MITQTDLANAKADAALAKRFKDSEKIVADHLRNLVEKLQTRHRSISTTDSAAAREVPAVQAKTER